MICEYFPEQGLPHAVYLPPAYDAASEKKHPLVVFLHGAGERGNDLAGVYRHGIFREVKEGRDFPFVAIAPQVDGLKFWACYSETLNAMLDGWIAQYHIDPARVYLTGLSMGGTGTWMWGMMNPERFAAIMPICGTGIYWCAGNLKDVPIWAFHGDRDPTVLYDESLRMVDAVNRCGGNAKLTAVIGAGHDSWSNTYRREDVYEWLLSHRKE